MEVISVPNSPRSIHTTRAMCNVCDDTGWKPVDENGVRRVERCQCWQEGLTSRLLDEARIPPRYRKCTLDNVKVYPNEGLINAVKAIRRFAEAFPVAPRGLCLIGPHGIGKTHLAVATLRDAIERTGARGLFFEVSDLLRIIRSTYNPVTKTAEMDVLQPLVSAQLLVLDDVGKEKTSEWVEETMTFIINARYNERLLTILTSNYEDNPDLEVLDSLKVRVGARMHSRMHEMCEFVEYGGADYRLLPPNGGVDDLMALWKVAGEQKAKLPSRAKGPVRAQLRPSSGKRDLGWPGGRAGS
jgi:DNA replication protein DnaC